MGLGSHQMEQLRRKNPQVKSLRDLLVDAERVPSKRNEVVLNLNRPEDWKSWISAEE